MRREAISSRRSHRKISRYRTSSIPLWRFIGAWQHSLKFLSAQGASSTEPGPSSLYEHQPANMWKGEVEIVPTPHLLINVIAGYGGYHVHYTDEPGTDVPGNPSSQELTTKLLTGPNDFPDDKPQNRYEVRGNVSYIVGRHQFKFGTEDTWEAGNTQALKDQAAGDYLLLFSKGVPNEIQTFNYPFNPNNELHNQSVVRHGYLESGEEVGIELRCALGAV